MDRNIIFTELSHIKCELEKPMHLVKKIEKGKDYDPYFAEVACSIRDIDWRKPTFRERIAEGFIFGPDHYTAREDRWEIMSELIGTQQDILDYFDGHMKFVDDKPVWKAYADLYFKNGDVQRMYFDTNEDLQAFMYKIFRELDEKLLAQTCAISIDENGTNPKIYDIRNLKTE